MTLKELGESFRAERERKGLTVEDVVQRTKISKSNVLGLEAGDTDALPHPVYAKGFVRNYAKLLGKDPEECAEIMAREFSGEDNVVSQKAAVEEALDQDIQEHKSSGKSGTKVFVLGLLVLGLLIAGVVYYYKTLPPKAEPVATAEPAPEASAPAQEVPIAPLEAPSAPAVEADEPVDLPPVESEPAASNTPQPEPVVEAAPEAPKPQVEVPAAASGLQRVKVFAREACWVYALVDGGEEAAGTGGVTVDVVLQPGQSKLIRYKGAMVLKLGNAGGVDVTLNGKPYPYEAQSGQVRTLDFTTP